MAWVFDVNNRYLGQGTNVVPTAGQAFIDWLNWMITPSPAGPGWRLMAKAVGGAGGNSGVIENPTTSFRTP